MCWQSFREQHVKAAKHIKVANAIAKKQGSVGEDAEAVAIAPLAVAGEAGEVVAGSAVAGEAGAVAAGSAVAEEAEQYVVWYEDAGVSEDDGFGPPCPEPKGLAGPLGPLREHPASASNPRPKKRNIQFVVVIEGPKKEYLSEDQEDINAIMRHTAFKHIAQKHPLPITKDAECGIQEPFNSGQCVTNLANRGTYISGIHFFRRGLSRGPTPAIHLPQRAEELGDWMFKEGVIPSSRP